LTAAAALVFRAYVSPFEKRATTTAAWRIVLLVINITLTVIFIIKTRVKARVMGDGDII